jgi:hypothetical protein
MKNLILVLLICMGLNHASAQEAKEEKVCANMTSMWQLTDIADHEDVLDEYQKVYLEVRADENNILQSIKYRKTEESGVLIGEVALTRKDDGFYQLHLSEALKTPVLLSEEIKLRVNTQVSCTQRITFEVHPKDNPNEAIVTTISLYDYSDSFKTSDDEYTNLSQTIEELYGDKKKSKSLRFKRIDK